MRLRCFCGIELGNHGGFSFCERHHHARSSPTLSHVFSTTSGTHSSTCSLCTLHFIDALISYKSYSSPKSPGKYRFTRSIPYHFPAVLLPCPPSSLPPPYPQASIVRFRKVPDLCQLLSQSQLGVAACFPPIDKLRPMYPPKQKEYQRHAQSIALRKLSVKRFRWSSGGHLVHFLWSS